MTADLPDSTYAVLGLCDKKPASGYDLAALADQSLAYFWPISRALVYRELRRLERLGWSRSELVPQERLPDKQVWSTTPEGRRALSGWLKQPAVSGSGNRNGFLLKFFLGARLPPESVQALLSDYRDSLRAARDDLAAVIERLRVLETPAARMGRLAALHGLRSAQAQLAWIDEVEGELPTSSPGQPWKVDEGEAPVAHVTTD